MVGVGEFIVISDGAGTTDKGMCCTRIEEY